MIVVKSQKSQKKSMLRHDVSESEKRAQRSAAFAQRDFSDFENVRDNATVWPGCDAGGGLVLHDHDNPARLAECREGATGLIRSC